MSSFALDRTSLVWKRRHRNVQGRIVTRKYPRREIMRPLPKRIAYWVVSRTIDMMDFDCSRMA